MVCDPELAGKVNKEELLSMIECKCIPDLKIGRPYVNGVCVPSDCIQGVQLVQFPSPELLAVGIDAMRARQDRDSARYAAIQIFIRMRAHAKLMRDAKAHVMSLKLRQAHAYMIIALAWREIRAHQQNTGCAKSWITSMISL